MSSPIGLTPVKLWPKMELLKKYKPRKRINNSAPTLVKDQERLLPRAAMTTTTVVTAMTMTTTKNHGRGRLVMIHDGVGLRRYDTACFSKLKIS